MIFETLKERKIGEKTTRSVLARELHTKLEVKKHFTGWMKDKIKQCFLRDSIDFELIWYNKHNEEHMSDQELISHFGNTQTAVSKGWSSDYILSRHATEEICMVAPGAVGKEMRTLLLRAGGLFGDTTTDEKISKIATPSSLDEATKLIETLQEEKEKLGTDRDAIKSALFSHSFIIEKVSEIDIASTGDITIEEFAHKLDIEGMDLEVLQLWMIGRGFLFDTLDAPDEYFNRGYYTYDGVEDENEELKITRLGADWLTRIIKAEYNIQD